MSLPISFQPVPVLIDGHDTQGQLVLVEGQLAAVLARLDGEAHGSSLRGRWHLEAGFGPCIEPGGAIFDTLDDAGAWVSERVLAKKWLLAG